MQDEIYCLWLSLTPVAALCIKGLSPGCAGAANLDALEGYTMLDHQPFDPTIKRTESVSQAVAAVFMKNVGLLPIPPSSI